jgi:hypothetical protein
MVYNNDIMNPDGKLPNMWAAMGIAKFPEANVAVGDLANYSAVYEFTPPVNETGAYVIPETTAIGPEELDWSYTAPDKYSFYSAFMSGAQRLKNGNTLITQAMQGRLFEVTPENEIVWEYWMPYKYDYKLPDGTAAQPGGPFIYGVFRSTLYTPDFGAFKGKALETITPQPEPFVFKMPPPPVQQDSAN